MVKNILTNNGYNLKHKETQNFINEWEQLYVTGDVFKLLEWHDSAVFWELSKKFIHDKHIDVNDIGYRKGVTGHHVFVNSVLGNYMDHFKGTRKLKRTSTRKDLRQIHDVDYWKKVPPA